MVVRQVLTDCGNKNTMIFVILVNAWFITGPLGIHYFQLPDAFILTLTDVAYNSAPQRSWEQIQSLDE